MKILKYESFLETMQFAALSNAQRLAKQEEERRKKSKEANLKDDDKNHQVDVNNYNELEPEGEESMDTEEGEESMDVDVEVQGEPND